MHENLTKEDIKLLRHQCRAGIVVSGLLFIIVFGILIALFYDKGTSWGFSLPVIIFVLLFIDLSFSYSIYLIMNGKYLTDIKKGKKLIKEFTLEQKELKQETEAGSGKLSSDGNMKTFIRYDIIINNTRYRIDKDFFEACKEGDTVLFHIAPRSNFRLYFQLKDNKNIKFS